MDNLPETREERAAWLAEIGGIEAAIDKGLLSDLVSLPLTEALVLGLMRQGVTKYLMILGHGSTELGETLRIYEDAGLVKGFQFRNEVEMAHAGTALRWVYNEPCAVVTSIGPGALQAMAGSLAASSNGIGLYHIYGDETTHGEGYNMQQVPKPEQGLFGQITAAMGASYTLHAPGAVRDALRRGAATVFHPWKAGPFFLNLPLNTQPETVELRLDALPVRPRYPSTSTPNERALEEAVDLITRHSKIAIKAGGGARSAAAELLRFAEAAGAAVVLAPGSTGVLPDAHPQNMHVGGSKGSISGNFAMTEADLVIFVGSRGVCQSDCSGIGWPNARAVININADPHDVQHYNNTLALTGDARQILTRLSDRLRHSENKVEWLVACAAKKAEWQAFKAERYAAGPVDDSTWADPVLTQPQAIHVADAFARDVGAVKFFDAGDVQANGFQVVEDNRPGETFTESGASYMGFAVSALLAGGLAEEGRYGIAFTGDGSFMMNPQVLIDGVEHGVHGTILLMDNRRMAAISHLQLAQYGEDYRTHDEVAVDYVQMASSVKGVKALWGGQSADSLRNALAEAHAHPGLSLIHLPVYYGPDPLGGMGAYGSWNVGNWCADVQKKYAATLI
ncbi:thiamine pyrophosphate-dependent enzyme [Roseibium sp. SCP14]|uniref:thiamine pyrophosphate-dependent enzyme n=1 Tax=Roseibium sp. SCP14 TaxID=3141375 RepID=UPI00333C0E4E